MKIADVRRENFIAIKQAKGMIFKILAIMGLIYAAEIGCVIMLLLK